MDDRRDVIKRIEEVGYNKMREAKHGTLYRHSYTGAIVSVPHTPGENRSLKNSLAEALSGAGKAQEGDTAIAVAAQIIASSDGPISHARIVELVVDEVGCTEGGVSVALTNLLRRGDNAIVRVKRGWYVWDEELAALPKIALESALEYLNGKNPQSAWDDGHTRRDMLKYGRDVARIRSPKPDEEEEPREKIEVDPELPTRLFELVATEPGAAGVALIRDEEGALWVARRLAAWNEL